MNNQPTPETKSFYVTAFDVEEWAEKCIRLEKERDDALSQIAQAECRAERFCQERDEARDAILGWENKWKCAIEYYVEFIRNASSDNKVSKPNPLNPFYKLT